MPLSILQIAQRYTLRRLTDTESTTVSSNSITMGPTTVSGMPTEIFEAIVDNVGLVDICNLRLTSSVLAAISTSSEFRSKVRHLRTDLSTKSLQSLIAVCSNHELKAIIDTIKIVTTFYELEQLSTQLKERKKWESSNNGPISVSTQSDMADEELVEAKKCFELLSELKEDQTALRNNGQDTAMLTQAFHLLGPKKMNINIESVVYRSDLKSPCRIRPIYGNDGVFRTGISATFHSMMSAIRRSDLTITSLSVFDVERSGGSLTCLALREALLAGSSPETLSLPSQLHSLESLTLSLSTWDGTDQKLPDTEAIIQPTTESTAHHDVLAALLSPLHSLKHLDLRIKGYRASQLKCALLFSHLAGSHSLSFPLLRTLHLRDMALNISDLLITLRA